MGESMNQHQPEKRRDKRVFPRMAASCPVVYRTNVQERWCVGVLLDFSATGVLMTCNRKLDVNTPISLRFDNSRHQNLPALSGSGIVIRSDELANSKYEVACKLTRIDPPGKASPSPAEPSL